MLKTIYSLPSQKQLGAKGQMEPLSLGQLGGHRNSNARGAHWGPPNCCRQGTLPGRVHVLDQGKCIDFFFKLI